MEKAMSVFSSFDYEGTGSVRIIKGDDGFPWYCAVDVCKALEYRNPADAIRMHCKLKGISKCYTLTSGGRQELLFISEANLYLLILRSHKPEAEAFEEWVVGTLIPAAMREVGFGQVGEAPALPQITLEYPRYIELLETENLFLKGRKRATSPRRMTHEEKETIGKLWGVMSATEIAEQINRDPRSVLYHAHKLGLVA